jgi:excinuclease UvrABC nuclease subunit
MSTAEISPGLKAPIAPREHVVYRFYDKNDRLLYVDCTVNLKARLQDHRETKDWFREVARTETAHFQSREEGLAAELKAIRTEDPVHNFRGKEGDEHFTLRELTYLCRWSAVEARLRARAEAEGAA